MPSVDHGVASGLWGIFFAVFIWFGMVLFKLDGATAFILGWLAGGGDLPLRAEVRRERASRASALAPATSLGALFRAESGLRPRATSREVACDVPPRKGELEGRTRHRGFPIRIERSGLRLVLIKVDGATAFILGWLAGGAIFLFVRKFGESEPRPPRRSRRPAS